MQPIYQAMIKAPNHQLQLKWNTYKIVVYSIFIFGLYYLFFFLPIHRESCPTNRAGWLCTNLATSSSNYIAFPARITLYWTVILFFLNIFISDYIRQELQHDDSN